MPILSIQSWVAYGHVGNAAAVLPLQRLGFEVWAVNTVQFSNHTGYGAWRGKVFPAEDVAEVIAGIADRGVLDQTEAVLTGYLGSRELGEVALDAVARVRAARPGAIWACDPVFGDVGRGVFVRPDLPAFFRDTALPHADIATPNHFELEYLTGLTVSSLPGALAAAEALRSIGPGVVLVTSLRRDEAPADTVELLAVDATGAWLATVERLPFSPNGAGDLIAALFLGNYLKSGDTATALASAAAAVQAVLRATIAAGAAELALVAALDELSSPREAVAVARVR